jgi:hypothetical protein
MIDMEQVATVSGRENWPMAWQQAYDRLQAAENAFQWADAGHIDQAIHEWNTARAVFDTYIREAKVKEPVVAHRRWWQRWAV